MLDLVQIAVADLDTAVADSQPRAIPITAGMVRPARAGAAKSDGQHAGSPASTAPQTGANAASSVYSMPLRRSRAS